MGLENASIPSSSEEFQTKLFHLICLLMQSVRNVSSPKELEESSKYLLTELTVLCTLKSTHTQSQRLLVLYSRNAKAEREADFLSFLSFFSYSQITQINPVF